MSEWLKLSERFPDTQDWCGHSVVSLRTWRCPDCGCSLSEQAKQRLQAAPKIAPEGHLWVYVERAQDAFMSEDDNPMVLLFTDRSKIAKRMIRDSIIDAKSLRVQLAQIHWYQGVYNTCIFEGWDEGTDTESPQRYRVGTVKIDSAA